METAIFRKRAPQKRSAQFVLADKLDYGLDLLRVPTKESVEELDQEMALFAMA